MTAFAMNILTMMGLAVGIDYSLFMISRYREERARGLEKLDAIAATGATASRAIFFSGMTVVLAMLGMVIVPLDVTISMGIGVMLVVITTLATALIPLPALMSLLGDRVNALRVPSSAAARRAATGGPASRRGSRTASCDARWSGSRSPSSCCSPRRAGPDHADRRQHRERRQLPDDEYAKQGWDILERDFSLGKANPPQIVIDGPADAPQVKRAAVHLQAAMKSDGASARHGHRERADDLTVVSTRSPATRRATPPRTP